MVTEVENLFLWSYRLLAEVNSLWLILCVFYLFIFSVNWGSFIVLWSHPCDLLSPSSKPELETQFPISLQLSVFFSSTTSFWLQQSKVFCFKWVMWLYRSCLDNLPISKSITLLTYAKSLLLSMLNISTILGDNYIPIILTNLWGK